MSVATAVEPLRVAATGGRLGGGELGWFLALLGWTILLSCYDLDGGARFEPIDCWVAQTAREMLDADDWLVPRFSSETRMQKSPGPYWAVMLVSLLRGTPVDEVAARVPSAAAAVLLVVIVYWLTRNIAGARPARFAGFAIAASVLVLWWSHRGASDLGLTTCTTLSLAALWIAAEARSPGWQRNLLFLLGYFAAGVGMLYKMPMPLAVVGAPAVAYVVLLRRWSILANPIHLLGVVVFLLPWLPWAIAVSQAEDAALLKWKVEFFDRFTGDLPNVEGQGSLKFLFTYLGPTMLYTLPFTLSLPGAFVRAFHRDPQVNRRGTLFMVIWFAALLVFFTASTGKEWRYFLPALPPLFVLLGIELAAFFDPQRPRPLALVRIGVIANWILVPLALGLALWIGLPRWYDQRGLSELAGLYSRNQVLLGFIGAAALLAVGTALAAWLYLRGRLGGSFATVVGMMWVTWPWMWSLVMPLVMSQRPFIDFAQQLAALQSPPPIQFVGTQDSRIIWYSDVRIPRVIDQLVLLKEQTGKRSLEYETERIGEEMVNRLAGAEPVLFVISLPDYARFLIAAPARLAEVGRSMPPVHLWLQPRYGREDRHYVLFGNRPPPFDEPVFRAPEKLRARIAAAQQEARDLLAGARSRPTSAGASGE